MWPCCGSELRCSPTCTRAEATQPQPKHEHTLARLPKRPHVQTRPADRYWDDTDVMSKISSKLRAIQLSKQQQDGADGADGDAPSKHAAAAPARKVETLHDAARGGDAEAATKMIADGADVNAKVRRGRAGPRPVRPETAACRFSCAAVCAWCGAAPPRLSAPALRTAPPLARHTPLADRTRPRDPTYAQSQRQAQP